MIKHHKTTITMALALVLTWVSGVTLNGSAHAADYFGAIAFSQTTGAHGYSYDYNSQREAEIQAMAECRKYGRGCEVATWVRNGCAALAVGDGEGWGGDWGNDRREAEHKALNRCDKNTGNCQIRRWVCTR